jgi:two-component system LytT family response regulator
VTIRTLIVDDEPLARQRVRDLLAGESEFAVAGECEDGFEAVAGIAELQPDVVYLDVQMPGLSGFDVLQQLDPPLPVIVFTTAYETYAVRAFEANALDYLLKPLDAARFHESAARVRAALSGDRGEWSDRIAALLARLEKRDEVLRRLVLKSGGRVFFIDVRDVDWFEAAGNYVSVHAAGASHLVRMTMNALEEKLDSRAFVRIHRGVIVNVQRIAELETRFRGDFVVVLKSGKKLDMARTYRDRLRAVMGDF